MEQKIKNMRTRLYLSGAIILIVGLGGATLIYWSAAGDSDQTTGFEIVAGMAYPISPENSKMYVHDLEVYGGKSAVLADEFRRWFVGLWQGRSLAVIIACSTVIVSLGLCIAAARLPASVESRARDKKGRTGTEAEM